MRMKDEEWNDIIETNLSSVFRLSKAVMRYDEKRHGRIITISSVVGTMGNGGQANLRCGESGFDRLPVNHWRAKLRSRVYYCKRCCSGLY